MGTCVKVSKIAGEKIIPCGIAISPLDADTLTILQMEVATELSYSQSKGKHFPE